MGDALSKGELEIKEFRPFNQFSSEESSSSTDNSD